MGSPQGLEVALRLFRDPSKVCGETQCQRIEDTRSNKDERRPFQSLFPQHKRLLHPDTARAPADEVFTRYRRLRVQIFRASQRVQEIRSRSWMQYNVPALTHILNRAFEDFRTSDAPYDFKKAARNDNPNPQSMSDHLANFLRHACRYFADIKERRDRVVLTCLVAWTLRSYGLG